VPTLRVRVVNITDLLILSDRGEHPHSLDDEGLASLFTVDRPVIFNFHGYPSALKGLLGERLAHLGHVPTGHQQSSTGPVRKVRVLGFVEQGTTTTPWSMVRMNRVDRYTVAETALRFVAGHAHTFAGVSAHELIAFYESQRRFHEKYVLEHGEDPAEFVKIPPAPSTQN